MYLELLCYKLAIMRVSGSSSVQILYMKLFPGTEENDNDDEENDNNRSNKNTDNNKNMAYS